MKEIAFLRVVSLLDAISYLVLLGVAVPMKHLWDQPKAVQITGPIHGGLVILLGLALLLAMRRANWSLWPPFLIFLAAMFPLAPFFADSWLKKEQLRLSKS
jgi:integral membrane protein